jgi:hypothetical protein
MRRKPGVGCIPQGKQHGSGENSGGPGSGSEMHERHSSKGRNIMIEHHTDQQFLGPISIGKPELSISVWTSAISNGD